MCQFWGIVIGDAISGFNAPVGFIDLLTFLRSVKRHHLSDFFFIIKIGEFQGERVSLAKERLLDLCLLAEEEHLEQPGKDL